jgi:transcription termination/antitermination protein NusG
MALLNSLVCKPKYFSFRSTLFLSVVTWRGEALSIIGYTATPDVLPLLGPAFWFAIQTYPRHEKSVCGQLTTKGLENYLPLVTRIHQWSDRRKQVEMPLFSGYAFVHIPPSPECRVQVLQVAGVLGFVGAGRQGLPIPDRQIEYIRTLLQNKISLDPYPFLKIGQRVRIRGGSLDGIEGILVRRNGMKRLIISVETLERSLSVCVEGLAVEGI